MTIAEILLIDFDAEAVSTRRVLERVPADKAGWQPHDKSFTLGALASHVATLASFGNMILTTGSLDLGATKFPTHQFTTAEEAVAAASGFAAEIRTNLAAMSDEDLQATWTLQFGEHKIFSGPRMLAYKMMFFNHLIHHRAQITVYLRQLDVAVPGIYGPSADEPFGG
ncbi:MAG: DinB family protein [Janthinobacterium lividum]